MKTATWGLYISLSLSLSAIKVSLCSNKGVSLKVKCISWVLQIYEGDSVDEESDSGSGDDSDASEGQGQSRDS